MEYTQPYNNGLTVVLQPFNDLIDDKTFKEPSEEFLEIVAKLGTDDEQFQKIIIDYYHMSTEKKKVFCEFFNTFVSGN